MFLNLNGKLLPESVGLVSPNNRSFRYGDGFFETIHVVPSGLLLKDLHFQRIERSLEKLKFNVPKHFDRTYWAFEIDRLLRKNHHDRARLRCTFFRGDGGLYDPENMLPNLLIQSWPLDNTTIELNSNGLRFGIFPDAKKSLDSFSNLKNNNFLHYAMAAIWAKEKKFNEALLLNSDNTIADATIANVFVVKRNEIFTPGLSQGPVDGVMRRYLIRQCIANGIKVHESGIGEEELLSADEVFFTNAIRGIRWAASFGDKIYGNTFTSVLHKKYIAPLFRGERSS